MNGGSEVNHRRFLTLSVAVLILLTLPGLAWSGPKKGKVCPHATEEAYVSAAAASARQSMNAVDPSQKVHFSKEGMNWSERCLQTFDRSVGCHFYRAVNTGLYYEATAIGYQRGLKQMIADALRVIELDPTYEKGGAYRLLGNIYLKAPLSGSSRRVTRDLEKARKQALMALQIDAGEPENQLLWGLIHYEEGNFEEAVPFLKSAIEGIRKRRGLTWYEKEELKKATRVLRKAEKGLTRETH